MSSSTTKNETQSEYSSKELDEKDLWVLTSLHERLDEWKQVAKRLGLSERDLQLIEAKHLTRDGIDECLYQALLKYRTREPENCYLENVVRALDVSVESVREYFASPHDKEKESSVRLAFYAASKNVDNLGNVRPSDRHLWQLADMVCMEWKKLGRVLGLAESSLSQIEARWLYKDGIRECAYQMLLLCGEIFYEQFNLESLCLSLLNLKLNLYVRKFLEIVL